MRRPASHFTALIAAWVALAVASMPVAPRLDNGRDVNRLIRTTRSGPQRERGDAVDHHHGDRADPIVAAAGDTIGLHNGPVHTPGHTPHHGGMPAVRPLAPPGPDTTFALLFVPPVSSSPLARPFTPARGRAPPLS